MKAFIFSGQGSQKEGMGQALVAASQAAARVYEQAADTVGLDILNLNEQQLQQTKYAQLAIVTMSMAAWAAYEEAAEAQAGASTDPSAFAGFSLGEYSALGAAGILTLTDLLKLTAVRADLMQEAASKQPGSMYAVIGMQDEVVEDILSQPPYAGSVFPVNYNCPGQLVISGLSEPAEQAAEALKSAGARRIVKLNVNGAFHTHYMSEAAEKLKQYASKLEFAEPCGIIYSNTDAGRVSVGTDWPQRLYDHMCRPVRWSSEIQAMREDGFCQYIEFGYGRVLTGLIRKIDRELIAAAVEDPESLAAALTL